MYRKFLKRIIDIIFGVMLIPLFLIIFIVFGLLIKIEDGGPVFYKASRIGKDMELFKMYKSRSMKVNSPILLNSDGSTYNSKKDPRVTRVGKFMRETSIDEIPQIINVLKGEMSFIGPRASLASVLETFKTDEVDKMQVRPGITGYTQAYFRNELTNREKRLLDAKYAKKVSLVLDVRIIFKTVVTVLKKDGIYTNENNSKKNTNI